MGPVFEAVRRGAVPRGRLTAALAAAIVLCAPEARADLTGDIRELSGRYTASGKVTAAPPRFFPGGSTTPLVVPPEFLSRHVAGCSTVVVLGAVSTVFVLRIPSATESFAPDEVVPSLAGAATVRRCGAAREALAGIAVDMRSPRGILETVYVLAPETAILPEVKAVLPHRDPGIGAGALRPGAPPTPAPLAARVAGFESRFRREGARTVERRFAEATKDGDGRLFIDFAPGCHHLAVLGPEVPPGMLGFYDVDAQLAWVTGDVAAVDKTESPDAVLTACVAEHTIGIVAFAGSGGGAQVVVVHALRDLPDGLPARWGPLPRARVARALLDRRIPGPNGSPVYQALGVAGITSLPIEVERGQCYLAVLSPVQGTGKLVSLSATSGARHSLAHASEPDTAVAVTFCAGNTGRGVLDVEVHGSSAVWVAALYPVARVRLGEEAP